MMILKQRARNGEGGTKTTTMILTPAMQAAVTSVMIMVVLKATATAEPMMMNKMRTKSKKLAATMAMKLIGDSSASKHIYVTQLIICAIFDSQSIIAVRATGLLAESLPLSQVPSYICDNNARS